jgi:hypothetical protein
MGTSSSSPAMAQLFRRYTLEETAKKALQKARRNNALITTENASARNGEEPSVPHIARRSVSPLDR